MNVCLGSSEGLFIWFWWQSHYLGLSAVPGQSGWLPEEKGYTADLLQCNQTWDRVLNYMAHGPPSAVSCRAAAGYKAELEGEGQGSVVKKKKKEKKNTNRSWRKKKTALSFIYGPSIILLSDWFDQRPNVWRTFTFESIPYTQLHTNTPTYIYGQKYSMPCVYIIHKSPKKMFCTLQLS